MRARAASRRWRAASVRRAALSAQSPLPVRPSAASRSGNPINGYGAPHGSPCAGLSWRRCVSAPAAFDIDPAVEQYVAGALDLEPASANIRAELARRYAERGDTARAQQLLAGAGPARSDVFWTVAENALRSGRTQEAIPMLRQILADDPQKRNAVVSLACSIASVSAMSVSAVRRFTVARRPEAEAASRRSSGWGRCR